MKRSMVKKLTNFFEKASQANSESTSSSPEHLSPRSTIIDSDDETAKVPCPSMKRRMAVVQSMSDCFEIAVEDVKTVETDMCLTPMSMASTRCNSRKASLESSGDLLELPEVLRALHRSSSHAVSEREVHDLDASSLSYSTEIMEHSFQFYRDDSYSVDVNWEQQPGPKSDAKFQKQFGLKFENAVSQSRIVLRQA
jgi:hypothetical protein